MSYSVCLACKEMVSSYQKYCQKCEKTYKQDKDFWVRTESYQCYNEPKRTEELKKDAISINYGELELRVLASMPDEEIQRMKNENKNNEA